MDATRSSDVANILVSTSTDFQPSEEGIHESVPEEWAQGISPCASEDIHKFSQSVGGDYRCGSSIIDGANDRYSVFGKPQ